MNTPDILIPYTSLLADIRSAAYTESLTLEPQRAAPVADIAEDWNSDRLRRILTIAAAEVQEILDPASDPAPDDAEDFSFAVTQPYAPARLRRIHSLIREYLTAVALEAHLRSVYPESAANWAQTAGLAISEIQAVHARTGPSTRPLSVF